MVQSLIELKRGYEQQLKDCSPEEQDAVMEWVWAQMIGTFGGKRWTDQYGQEPSPVWRDSLQAFFLKEIKGGCEAMRSFQSPFMPDLPKFLAACRGSGLRHNPGTFSGGVGKVLERAAANSPADPEVKRRELEKLREVLRKSSSSNLKARDR